MRCRTRCSAIESRAPSLPPEPTVEYERDVENRKRELSGVLIACAPIFVFQAHNDFLVCFETLHATPHARAWTEAQRLNSLLVVLCIRHAYCEAHLRAHKFSLAYTHYPMHARTQFRRGQLQEAQGRRSRPELREHEDPEGDVATQGCGSGPR